MIMQLQSRSVVKQSPISSTFFTYSPKCKRVSVVPSRMTKDYLNLLEFDQNVQDVVASPFKVEIKLPGRAVRHHTPSFLVVDENGEESVHDVLSSKYVATKDFQLKHDRLVHQLQNQGRSYQLVTERDIYVGHRASNLAYLAPALKLPCPSDNFAMLTHVLAYRTVQLPQLMHDLVMKGIDPAIVRRAIAHRLITCDLTKPWEKLQLSWEVAK